jgi:dsDNA-specific endonuclease/ATPase MutS2
MEDLKAIIDKIRVGVESGLTQLEEAQNDLIHQKMEPLKDNENVANLVSKVQLLNEQYSGQVYDGLKVVNAVIAQKSKELVDKMK